MSRFGVGSNRTFEANGGAAVRLPEAAVRAPRSIFTGWVTDKAAIHLPCSISLRLRRPQARKRQLFAGEMSGREAVDADHWRLRLSPSKIVSLLSGSS